MTTQEGSLALPQRPHELDIDVVINSSGGALLYTLSDYITTLIRWFMERDIPQTNPQKST
eukprot:CAMPEP_0182426510 /NCGR_PEP_ID=MMETSP1167-20130531/13007_1 /TAXON_ID=2988 /ORGANISM="Mallomonas Sp, Strain CCMP3275" /LENGTH=59 /DNA_ID=CAMNT_0024607987 /DNA_START=42 /DNA_END=217 /DNA_ORIENTATION=-